MFAAKLKKSTNSETKIASTKPGTSASASAWPSWRAIAIQGTAPTSEP